MESVPAPGCPACGDVVITRRCPGWREWGPALTTPRLDSDAARAAAAQGARAVAAIGAGR